MFQFHIIRFNRILQTKHININSSNIVLLELSLINKKWVITDESVE